MLAVDDESDIFNIIEEEIMDERSLYALDKAAIYDEAAKHFKEAECGLVILDILGVRGFKLLEFTVKKKLKAVVMLTVCAFNTEALRPSMGIVREYAS